MKLLIGAVVLIPWTVYAQPGEIQYSTRCSTCLLESRVIAQLGTSQDPVLLDRNGFLARDSRGRYFASGFGAQSVVVFDSSGRYSSSFGRSGQWPGEFGGRIVGLYIRFDTLHAFTSDRRVKVYSPSLTLVRETRLPRLPQQEPRVLGSNSSMLIAGYMNTPDTLRFPFHLVDANGFLQRSLGDPVNAMAASRSGP